MTTLARTTLGKLEVGKRFQLPGSTNVWTVMEHDRAQEKVRVSSVDSDERKVELKDRWWLALMEVDIEVDDAKPARYRVTFEVDVRDEAELLAYADVRIAAAFGTTLEDLTTGGESKVERALIEAILFSNENPSPDEYGIEFPGMVECKRIDA